MSDSIDRRWSPCRVRGKNAHQLVDYIVVAEFDIDTGSTVRHLYPSNIPNYKMDWFAEYMLPEGAHNRDSDFTYIFLNRENQHIDEELWIKPINLSTDAMNAKSEQDKETATYFLYGLNLVKRKHDSSVRRGAVVKAMAIFSKYHFIEAFKKPLDLALEKYYLDQSVDVMKELYDTLNAIDITNLPRPDFLEQSLMRRGVHYETITKLEKNSDQIQFQPSSWVISLPYSTSALPSLEARAPEDSSVPPTTETSSPSSPSTKNTQENIMNLSIPLYRTPDEVGDLSISDLIRVFGDSTMRIYHAILTKQRVLFVGYNHAAKDVGRMVLSAVSMVSPPMTNIIRRTFPYATLSDLGFLEVINS